MRVWSERTSHTRPFFLAYNMTGLLFWIHPEGDFGVNIRLHTWLVLLLCWSSLLIVVVFVIAIVYVSVVKATPSVQGWCHEPSSHHSVTYHVVDTILISNLSYIFSLCQCHDEEWATQQHACGLYVKWCILWRLLSLFIDAVNECAIAVHFECCNGNSIPKLSFCTLITKFSYILMFQ